MLVEPGRHVGGMVSGGLCWTDVGDTRALGGLARRFYARRRRPLRRAALGREGPGAARRGADARGAARRAGSTCASASASCRTRRSPSTRATRATCWPRAASRTRSAASRASSTARPGPAASPPTGRASTTSPCSLSPFADDGSLLPHVREPELDERGWPAERLGEGDGGLQAYGFRVCLTDRDGEPAAARAAARLRPGRLRAAAPLPRRRGRALARTRSPRPRARPAPERQVRRQLDRPVLAQPARRLQPRLPRRRRGDARARPRRTTCATRRSLLHFLAHDDAVPAHIRDEVARWGPCADEFEDTARLAAPALRPRRAAHGRRVRADGARPPGRAAAARTSSRSARTTSTSARSSGRGATCPSTTRTPAVFNEGYLSVAVPPYPIPYRSLTPRREDAEDLLVPVCLSASHVAFGSVRMEPTLMLLGHAAGRRPRRRRGAESPCRTSTSARCSSALRESGQVLAL